MYRQNKRSQQPLLISNINDLPERTQKYLQQSWAESFRREVFLRIPEERFAVLYDQDPSRPNVPVNILVGLEILKEWHGWSDEEMYEHFLFDLQVRYALCCDDLKENNFDVRTLYYFRQRVSQYALKEEGENLMKVVFEHITDEQLKKLAVKTGLQRMDSTQIMSNIADLSRLELLVGVMQRLHHMLSEVEQAEYTAFFQPYIKGSAGQYSYRIRGKAAVEEHIQRTGEVLNELLSKLANKHSEEAAYQLAQRFFAENFVQEPSRVRAKTNQEITAGCLQSLDDLEATYRVNGHRAYKGYVANLTETCDPANPLQLITDVQVAPNRTSDIELLQAAVPGLTERTDLEKLVTDGSYVSPDSDELLGQNGLEQIMTALTGTLPDHQGGKLAFSDFDMLLDANQTITQATCLAGQSTSAIQPTIGGKGFRLIWNPAVCRACPFYQQHLCPVHGNQSDSVICQEAKTRKEDEKEAPNRQKDTVRACSAR